MSRSGIRVFCFVAWACLCLFANAEEPGENASSVWGPLLSSVVYFGLLALAAAVAALAVRMVRRWQ